MEFAPFLFGAVAGGLLGWWVARRRIRRRRARAKAGRNRAIAEAIHATRRN